jgi:DNA polymerase-3 subunit beta
MKFNCLRHHLKDTLSLIEKISSKNITLPILNGVLISAKKESLKFTATNLEIGVEIKIPARIIKEGEITVPARILHNFLFNLAGDENLTLESSQNNLLISIKNSSTLIKGYSTEDFPVLPFIRDKEKSFILPVSDFILGLKCVHYAAALSDMKPEIASIFVVSDKSTPFTFAATDSFRLAVKIFPFNLSDFPPILIPSKNVLEIMRILENEDGNLKIIPAKNQIFLISDRLKIISRLTEGVFPNYREIIPKSFSIEAVVDKSSFSSSLKTANVFSGKLNEIKIEVIPGEKSIKLHASNADLGEHSTSINADIRGEEIKMTFNYKYLSESLQFVDSDKVILKFNDENKPVLITGAKDNSFIYLVMPMRDL